MASYHAINLGRGGVRPHDHIADPDFAFFPESIDRAVRRAPAIECGRIRDLHRVFSVRPEVGVVPVGMGKIEIDLDVAFMCGIAQLFDDVPPKRRLHDAVTEVAGLNFWTSWQSP